MKIRIKGNSIRLRLTRSEVSAFARSGCIVEQTCFGLGRSMTYMLRAARDARAISARYWGDTVTVCVPMSVAQGWGAGDDVALSDEQPVGDGQWLSILIEKDFQCLHGDAVPDPDAYPHPAEV